MLGISLSIALLAAAWVGPVCAQEFRASDAIPVVVTLDNGPFNAGLFARPATPVGPSRSVAWRVLEHFREAHEPSALAVYTYLPPGKRAGGSSLHPVRFDDDWEDLGVNLAGQSSTELAGTIQGLRDPRGDWPVEKRPRIEVHIADFLEESAATHAQEVYRDRCMRPDALQAALTLAFQDEGASGWADHAALGVLTVSLPQGGYGPPPAGQDDGSTSSAGSIFAFEREADGPSEGCWSAIPAAQGGALGVRAALKAGAYRLSYGVVVVGVGTADHGQEFGSFVEDLGRYLGADDYLDLDMAVVREPERPVRRISPRASLDQRDVVLELPDLELPAHLECAHLGLDEDATKLSLASQAIPLECVALDPCSRQVRLLAAPAQGVGCLEALFLAHVGAGARGAQPRIKGTLGLRRSDDSIERALASLADAASAPCHPSVQAEGCKGEGIEIGRPLFFWEEGVEAALRQDQDGGGAVLRSWSQSFELAPPPRLPRAFDERPWVLAALEALLASALVLVLPCLFVLRYVRRRVARKQVRLARAAAISASSAEPGRPELEPLRALRLGKVRRRALGHLSKRAPAIALTVVGVGLGLGVVLWWLLWDLMMFLHV